MARLFPPTLSSRSYLSTHFLWAARHFTELASGIEVDHTGRFRFDPAHRSFVLGAVLSAVSFAEGLINELYQDATDGHESHVGELESSVVRGLAVYWRESDGRASVVEKCQVALVIAGAEPFDAGAPPLQDMLALIRLRNHLVHFKPSTRDPGVLDILSRQLKGKFEESRLMTTSGNAFFPDKCLGAGCAGWGVAAATAFARELCSRLGVMANFQRVVERL